MLSTQQWLNFISPNGSLRLSLANASSKSARFVRACEKSARVLAGNIFASEHTQTSHVSHARIARIARIAQLTLRRSPRDSSELARNLRGFWQETFSRQNTRRPHTSRTLASLASLASLSGWKAACLAAMKAFSLAKPRESRSVCLQPL